ncbi:hypothetical protein WN944_023794 [Citrus x changshan-huyou]|uniref:Uncharacterized protein n=1 Tax=Citrus x changshan-huyou TaxID=2935761 RepID=A0AAP0LMI3_9ROSI
MSFALPDLNDEVHIEQMTAIEGSLEWMLANNDGDVYADKLIENKIENDLPHADSEGEFNEVVGVALNDRLDDYQFGDDSGYDSDETNDKCCANFNIHGVNHGHRIKNSLDAQDCATSSVNSTRFDHVDEQ